MKKRTTIIILLFALTGQVSAKTVLWDASHGEYGYVPNVWFSALSNHLAGYGFEIDTTYKGFLVDDPGSYDIAVVCVGSSIYSAYTTEEAEKIKDFVVNGGGLLIMGEMESHNDNIQPVASAFGISLGVSKIGSYPYAIYTSDFAPSPLFDGIDEICFQSVGELSTSGNIEEVAWYEGTDRALVVAGEYGYGRVVALGDINIFSSFEGGKYYDRADNRKFSVNTFEYLVPEPATTYYVDALNGDDDNDGLSPETAFATIQKGIDSADDGDTVIVAPGTYTGPGNRDIDFLGKAITVRSENGPENCIIDCQRAGRGFYFYNGEDQNSVLDGFTIINGYVYGDWPGGSGGGIYCNQSSPTLTNCIITGNSAKANWGSSGGGISCQGGSPKITHCTISDNCARYGGGGIACEDSSPTITNCVITANTSEGNWGSSGGGVYFYCGVRSKDDCTFTITNCAISGNSARYGGGICCGGAYDGVGGMFEITNCDIKENSAEFSGGGIYCGGEGTRYGPGGIFIITDCTINGNSAASDGGAIYCEDDNIFTMTNCTIAENTASIGGGIYFMYSNPTITNCTLAENSALNGNALACDSWGRLRPSNVQMTNCILADGGNEIWNDDGSAITITYSDVQGSWPGDGNIDEDPCFVDPDSNDFHLLAGSPCIDAGDNTAVPADTTDLDGNPRILDGNNDSNSVVDMGAYEYEAMVSCFGVNHIKLETKAGKKGNKVELKGTFSPALPIDFARDDVAYIIDDGQGNALVFLIPAGSFEPEGKPEKQKFKFHSAKGSEPDIKARFDFDKCKFELKAKRVQGTDEITSTTLTIELWAGANVAQEMVEVKIKPRHLEYKREPKLSCCPKCKGIALLEVTSDQGVFVFEPEPGKEKLKRKTVVDDGVNGRVKIDTSCSKPLEVGDVFGVYTVTDLIKIFDDDG